MTVNAVLEMLLPNYKGYIEGRTQKGNLWTGLLGKDKFYRYVANRVYYQVFIFMNINQTVYNLSIGIG